MLTRDLLRFKRKKGFFPAFVDPADAELLKFASQIVSLYNQAVENKISRAELDELLETSLQGVFDRKLAAGLNKLLLDRCEFAHAHEFDYPTERRKILLEAKNAMLASLGDLKIYREILLAQNQDGKFINSDIYGDLPDNEQIVKWKPLSPSELLNRYNIALVQGLLMYAQTIEVTVSDSRPAELRRVFKYMRFFRLLSEMSHCKERGRDSIFLRISGPFSIFENSRKYALLLAAFFPAIVNLERWNMVANIRLENAPNTLKLDQNARLVSHYRNFSSYVPEEIRLFHQLFKKQSSEWRIVGESPFIDGGNNQIVFPDLSFRRESDGKTIYLELFHRWHRAQLERRLQLLECNLSIPLIVGIDRALIDDSAWSDLTEQQYPALANRLFRFRDFPGVDRVTRVLNAFS
ncbi:MAG: DUF790 family protein [Victivallales bacterium]|jgi:predicted nuclease of restriction endonuclease-like RecB superfamily|nr:DUF790 family protein [Victivallales bacterium]